ncbi:hypothetical protein CO615_03165 [Lysobacteraceae bacterium NML75-0749]|nr:hypothetical protein CO615_03165 [Xanthomonadaceae bacterium NML75-0749]PJK02616.1 hypothetical protein CO609_09050 [Xanthomonadaceae bacterium NML91-0268]PJK03066.1 hypothetical protein CO612_09475 [Xanthomonadaceae bacterium NML71-0210]
MVVALAALVSLSACDKLQGVVNSGKSNGSDAIAAAQQRTEDVGKTDPLLENPQVGDLYAAKLSAISAIGFSDARNNNTDEEVFGLLKVVEVKADSVVVITENSGWPNARGARNDLRGDLKDIGWDEEERIILKRQELPALMANGDIIETRRL